MNLRDQRSNRAPLRPPPCKERKIFSQLHLSTSCLLAVHSPQNLYDIFIQLMASSDLWLQTKFIIKIRSNYYTTPCNFSYILLYCYFHSSYADLPWQLSHSLEISTSCGLKCNSPSSSTLNAMNSHSLFTRALNLQSYMATIVVNRPQKKKPWPLHFASFLFPESLKYRWCCQDLMGTAKVGLTLQVFLYDVAAETRN